MRPSASRIAATALLVAVADYVGANLGFILRFPPATPSVMWPPNAILTATLLLAPPRPLLAAAPTAGVQSVGEVFRRRWPPSPPPMSPCSSSSAAP